MKNITNLLSPENRFSSLFSLLAGALTVFAFAPFNQPWLIFIAMAVLFYSWSGSSPKRALINGWLFGIGMQCTGVSWIYYSLHFHGGSPPFLAVVIIFLLATYLSIYPALAGFVINRFCKSTTTLRLLLLYPVAWALFEWLQGIVMTGFSWMQLGYTQIDLPLSGYAPVIGNHGVGLLVAFTSGWLVLFVTQKSVRKISLSIVIVIWVLGFALKQVNWTTETGDSIQVALLQGNITQDKKWKREMRQPTLNLYRELSLQQERSDLIIWPETAIPSYLHGVTNYVEQLKKDMQARDADLLAGLFIKDSKTNRYFNSLINVRGGEYRKRHLVPLGEYIPLRILVDFFNRWIHIPMSDIDVGDPEQPLLQAAGQPLGVSICFEDAFARDVLSDLPRATLLVNVSNDAWFDGSHEAYQHHVIARMRALETGRYMLRATNTGISSIIGPRGEEIAVAPLYERHVLNAEVQPMKGSTPYVIWGDYLVLIVGMIVIGGFIYRLRINKRYY